MVGNDNHGFSRRNVLKTVGAGALASMTLSGQASADASDTHFHNPVFEPVFPDPAVIRAKDGYYYAYGTECSFGDGVGYRTVPIVRSADLVNWEHMGEVFGTRPTLTDHEPSSGDPTWKYNDRGVWAPDVIYHNGLYRLYYSLHGPNPSDSAIGVATSDSPTGPWTDHGHVVGGGGNTIDPFVLIDDGTPYMFHGSYGQSVYVAEMDADAMTVVGDWVQVCRDGFEGAHVRKRNGWYYMFLSNDLCCTGHDSTYHVTVSRADSITGPYYDVDGLDMNVDGHSAILERDSRFAGPGHNTIANDPHGNEWLLYHAYDTTKPENVSGTDNSQTERRSLMLDRIDWSGGWPSVHDGTPSETASSPVSQLDPPIPDGTYRLINKHSGKALEVYAAETVNGTNIQQYDYNGGAWQHWRLTHRGNGYYSLVADHSGKAADVVDWSTDNGANVIQYDYNETPNQLWQVTPVGSGFYTLTNQHSGKALEVDGWSQQNDANVHQWDQLENPNQQWRLDLV